MNSYKSKAIALFLILIFCLTPLNAIELNQDDNSTIDDVDEENIIEDNDKEDIINNNNITNNSIEEDDMKDTAVYNNDPIDKNNESNGSVYKENSLSFTPAPKPNLKVNVDDIEEGEYPFITVTANSSITGYVRVFISGEPLRYKTHIDIDIVNGKGSATYDAYFPPGKYNARAIYFGDEIFNPQEAQTNYTIWGNPKLNIKIDDVKLGQKPVAVINASNTLNGKAEVKLNSSTKVYTVEIVNGTAKTQIDENLKAGEYKATVTFNGDDTFKAAEKTTTFKVEKINPNLSVSIKDIYKGESMVAEITANSSLNGTGSLELYYSNSCKVNTSIYIKDGHVTERIGGLVVGAVGNYTLIVRYKGDDTFKAVEKTTTFTVKYPRIDPNLNIKVDNITDRQKAIAVITANNSISCNMKVRLNDSSLACPVEIVNGTGNVTIDRNLSAGQYTATLIYDGDDTFMPSNKSTTFTVIDPRIDPKLNIKIKDVKAGQKAVAEITSDADLKGKWLPVEVKLKDSRYSYTGYVIDGKANITIDYVLPIGEYTATLYYPGNDEYKPVNKSTTFTVK